MGRPLGFKSGCESKTSHRKCRAREFEMKAFELRKRGLTYQEISKELGVSSAAANIAVQRVIAEMRELTEKTAEEVIELELRRLDTAHEKVWPGVLRGRSAEITMMLRIMERRSKLLGLDKPSRVKHEVDESDSQPREKPGLTASVAEFLRCRVLGIPLTPAAAGEAQQLSEDAHESSVSEVDRDDGADE